MGLLKKVVNNGDVFVKGLLILIIEDLVLFLNVGKTMNKEQVNQTADLILSEFNFLRVEDFKLCFNNAKKGIYGKQYDRLDGQVIFEWLNVYSNERANESERLNSLKKFESNEKANPEGQKKVTEILSLAVKELKEKEIIQDNFKSKIKEPDERTKKIQGYFKEFDLLHSKERLEINKKKFLNYKGKTLDEVEFVEFRLKEDL